MTIHIHPRRFLDAIFIMKDGNFQAGQKNKKIDTKDVPLSMGKAYFVHMKDYEEYLAGSNGDDLLVRHSAFS